MLGELEFGAALVALITAATLAGRRIDVPPSILLVVIGALLAFVPFLPDVKLDPDLVLLVVLPPLVYSAGVATSWPDFRRDLPAITLLAVGGVVFTAAAVAAAAHWLAGLAWGVAFLLGAIVSPPDVVAPLAVVGPLRVPRRLVTILNGEGLVNDVTALVLVGFATAAVSTGTFSAPQALGTFCLVVAAELVWGYAVGWASLRLRRWSDDVRVEITVSLLTPYIAFWPAHALGGSGVLAAAVTGLLTSWTGPQLISAATRLQGTFVWNLVVYLLTGLVFVLTGLQARNVMADIGAHYGWGWLTLYAIVICGVAIVARFAWVFLSNAALLRGRGRGWRAPFLIAFTGIRGVVSLAAAFSVPLAVASGAPFPGRDLILFLTFVVIFATLVAQGLALPTLIRRLGLDKIGAEEAERDDDHERTIVAEVEHHAVLQLGDVASRYGLADDLARDIRTKHETRERLARLDPATAERGNAAQLALIETQREIAWARFTACAITDEARRRIEHELDLEETRIRRAANEAVPDGT